MLLGCSMNLDVKTFKIHINVSTTNYLLYMYEWLWSHYSEIINFLLFSQVLPPFLSMSGQFSDMKALLEHTDFLPYLPCTAILVNYF